MMGHAAQRWDSRKQERGVLEKVEQVKVALERMIPWQTATSRGLPCSWQSRARFALGAKDSKRPAFQPVHVAGLLRPRIWCQSRFTAILPYEAITSAASSYVVHYLRAAGARKASAARRVQEHADEIGF